MGAARRAWTVIFVRTYPAVGAMQSTDRTTWGRYAWTGWMSGGAAARDGGRAGGLDEPLEQLAVILARGQRLGVPLDGQHELTIGGLHALDDPVGRPGHRAQAVAEIVDRLVV